MTEEEKKDSTENPDADSSEEKGEKEDPYSPGSEELLNMPTYLARSLLYVVLAGVGTGLGWAAWGKKDVVVKAPGGLVRKGEAQIVQAGKNGVIRSVYIKEGDPVRKGQTLGEFDTSKEKINTEKQKNSYKALVKKKDCEEKALEMLLRVETAFDQSGIFPQEILGELSKLCSSDHGGPIVGLKKAIGAYKKAKIQALDFVPKELEVKAEALKAKQKAISIKRKKLKEADKDIARIEEELNINVRALKSNTTQKLKSFEAQQKIKENELKILSLNNAVEKGKATISMKRKELQNAHNDVKRIEVELEVYKKRFEQKTSGKLKLFEAQRKYSEALASINTNKNSIEKTKRKIKDKSQELEHANTQLKRLEQEIALAKQMFATGQTDTLKFMESQKKYEEGAANVKNNTVEIEKVKRQIEDKKKESQHNRKQLARLEEELKMAKNLFSTGQTDTLKFMETQKKYEEGAASVKNNSNEIEKIKRQIEDKKLEIQHTKKQLKRLDEELKLAKKLFDTGQTDTLKFMESQRKFDEANNKVVEIKANIKTGTADLTEKKQALERSKSDLKRYAEEAHMYTQMLEEGLTDRIKYLEVQRKYDDAKGKMESAEASVKKAQLQLEGNQKKLIGAKVNLERTSKELEFSRASKENKTTDKAKLLEAQKKHDEASNKLLKEKSQLENLEASLESAKDKLENSQSDLVRLKKELEIYRKAKDNKTTDRTKLLEAQRKLDEANNKILKGQSELENLSSSLESAKRKLENSQSDLIRLEKELEIYRNAKENKTTDKRKLLEAQRKYESGLEKVSSLENEITGLRVSLEEGENKSAQSRENLQRLEFEKKIAEADFENATTDKMKLIEVQRKLDSARAKITGLENEIENIKLQIKENEYKVQEAKNKLENMEFELKTASLNKDDKVKVLETNRKYDEAKSKRNSLHGEIAQAVSEALSHKMNMEMTRNKNNVQWEEAQENYNQALITFKQSIVAAKNKVKTFASNLAQMDADRQLFVLHKAKSFLKSPSDGVVSFVKPKGPGEVVRAGETLFSVILSNQPLIAKIKIPNRSRGKVKVGQAVKVKMDAFPFQKYGVVKGKLTTISPNSKTEKGNSFYSGTVSLENEFVEKSGQNFPLVTGMTMMGEIVVEQITMLDSILKPFRALKGR